MKVSKLVFFILRLVHLQLEHKVELEILSLELTTSTPLPSGKGTTFLKSAKVTGLQGGADGRVVSVSVTASDGREKTIPADIVVVSTMMVKSFAGA